MYLTQLYPAPRSYTKKDSTYVFGAHVTMRISFSPRAETVERIVTLWRRFTCDASTLALTYDAMDGSFAAVIGENAPTEPLASDDTYRLSVRERTVSLVAESEKAFLDGFMILLQCAVYCSALSYAWCGIVRNPCDGDP